MAGHDRKRVLMIAYHFPPMAHSSGIQRALKFATYLREYGWQPIVLSAHPRSYSRVSDAQLGEIPGDVPVYRAFALNAQKHLAIQGRYLKLTALPDVYSSWALGALPKAWWLVKKYSPELIWSTFPITTAHVIGRLTQRMTGLPWVADCRDPMSELTYPRDPIQRRANQRVERSVVRHASRVVFTAPGSLIKYRNRYPDLPERHWSLIPNGFDEESFSTVVPSPRPGAGAAQGPLTLLHSGTMYPEERDPTAFFAALGRMKRTGRLDATRLRVILRAAVNEEFLTRLMAEHDIADIVELRPHLPYQQALQEMVMTDGLLLFQSTNCNHQIPAKIYEYFRAQRPILAITDPQGDTARLMAEAGVHNVLPMHDTQAIERGLELFLTDLRAGRVPVVSDDHYLRYSRRASSAKLAELFDQVLAEQG